MFLDFFLFEIKLRLKSISTYCYLGLWTLLAFMFVAAEDFGPVPAGKILLNGPYATQLYDFQLTFFGAIVIAAIFGTSILRAAADCQTSAAARDATVIAPVGQGREWNADACACGGGGRRGRRLFDPVSSDRGRLD